MTTEFDKLLAQVHKMNKISGEVCMICQFPDKVENLLQLDCKHYYHNNCIKRMKTSNCSYIKCPYCKKKTILETINKYDIPNKKSALGSICFTVLKSGPNKGMQCGRTNCKYHLNNKKILPLSCNVTIKSGSRKGEICGRTNCKYHKKKLDILV